MTNLKTPFKVAAALPGALLGLIGTGIAYSRWRIPHNLPLTPALDAPQGSFNSRDAGVVAYYADVSGTGVPLVLVHSINAAASALELKPLFDHFRGQRPVYALDLPGYGLSDRSQRDYTPQLFADVIRQFMHDVVGGSADVIALSLGSEFAARAAHDEPALFKSLALISPTGFTKRGSEGRTERTSQREGSDRAYRFLTFPLWSQAIYDLIVSRRSLRFYLAKSFEAIDPPQELLDYGYVTGHQPKAKNVPLHFLSGRLFTRDIRRSIYPHLTVPTLVLYDRDAFVTFEMLEPFVAEHPLWHARRIAGTAGLPHWEETDATVRALAAFWQSLAVVEAASVA